MSGFISNLVENFVEKQTGSGHNQTTSYSETETYDSSSYNSGGRGPPQVPYPWRAHWDESSQTYIYIHQETGERVYEYDEVIRRTQTTAGGYGGGYQQQDSSYYQQSSNYSSGYGGGRYGGGERVYESEQVEERSSGGGGGHGMMYGALGAAAGLAVGAGAMYEGEKIHNDWEEDKYRVENDVEYAPERIAGWTGEKVGEVEAIPQDVEYGVDRFDNRVEQDYDDVKYGIEDAPETAANWIGNKVGDVERFDDNIDNAYDAGRDEGRYDDRW